MPVTLPAPIAAYFAADKEKDSVALASRFAPDAVVIDERCTYEGREAISAWKAQSSTKYAYVVDPISLSDEDGTVIVTARLTGNFPSSPVDLRYAFVIEGDAITRLEIAP